MRLSIQKKSSTLPNWAWESAEEPEDADNAVHTTSRFLVDMHSDHVIANLLNSTSQTPSTRFEETICWRPSSLYRRFAGAHRTAWPHSSFVCWRHADLRLLSSVGDSDALQLQERVSGCVDDVAKWMQSNRLQFNTAKTEVLWCASIRRQHQILQPGLRVGVDVIVPSASVRDLGIYLDWDVSMRTHVSKVVSSCFAVLRRLRSIRSSVTRPAFVSLVVSLVLSRLDYCNATLAGITDSIFYCVEI